MDESVSKEVERALTKAGIASVSKEVERALTKAGIADRIINCIKIGLQSAAGAYSPVASTFASLISELIPSRREARLEEFAKSIAEDLNKFENEVSSEYLKTEEFGFIFETCFRRASENYQTEKIQAFKAILINSIKDKSTLQDEKEFYLSLVDRLSVIHIKILSFLAEPERYMHGRQISITHLNNDYSGFFGVILPDVSLDLIKAIIQELYGFGFLSKDRGIFNSMGTSKGLFLLKENIVTPSGYKFIRFISLS